MWYQEATQKCQAADEHISYLKCTYQLVYAFFSSNASYYCGVWANKYNFALKVYIFLDINATSK